MIRIESNTKVTYRDLSTEEMNADTYIVSVINYILANHKASIDSKSKLSKLERATFANKTIAYKVLFASISPVTSPYLMEVKVFVDIERNLISYI